MKAYVYAILVDDVIRYIGKGSGKRSAAHMRIVRSILRRRAAGETVHVSQHFYNRLANYTPLVESSNRVTLAELDMSSHCRFPIGEPHSPEFRYCGALREFEGEGSAPHRYCAAHARLTYVPQHRRTDEERVIARRKYAADVVRNEQLKSLSL